VTGLAGEQENSTTVLLLGCVHVRGCASGHERDEHGWIRRSHLQHAAAGQTILSLRDTRLDSSIICPCPSVGRVVCSPPERGRGPYSPEPSPAICTSERYAPAVYSLFS
jgi:hypothetical protein